MAAIGLWLMASASLPVAGAQACENNPMTVEGAAVRVFTSRELGQDSDCRWTTWIEHSVASVAGISGRFPFDRVNVYLERSNSSQPVAHGFVRRNNPPEIHLRIQPGAGLDELLDDWRGYHEFAHLLLPFVGNRDIWFAEGLASYYQYFLQARAGVIDEDQAWQRLAAGFQRGLDDPAGRGQSLKSLSPRMWSERAFRRVYWTGAAFFLRVDYRLRKASAGEHSLDTVLAAFQECCMYADADRRNWTSNRRWNAARLIDELGHLSLSDIWQEEYQRTINQRAEPDFGASGRYLGLQIEAGELKLLSGPLYRERRASIAMGRMFDTEIIQPRQAALIDELDGWDGFVTEPGSVP